MTTVANTPVKYYLDTRAVKRACKKDFDKIDKACKPDNDPSNSKNKSPTLKKLLGAKRANALDSLMRKGGQEKNRFSPNNSTAWMDHCDGLWVKPSTGNIAEEFNQQLQDLVDDLTNNIDGMLKPLLDKVGQEIKDAAWDAAQDKAVKAGARSAGRWVVGASGAAAGGVGAVVTEGIATAWNVVDWVGTGWDMWVLAWETRAAIKEMKSILEIADKARQELDNLVKSASSMSPTDMMGNAMAVLAKLNPCTRARRCLLVPFKNTLTTSSLGGEGCCPGQTGHHVIPQEAVESCEGYSHQNAPTICVEGTNNQNGTHGKAHGDLGERIEDYKQSGWFEEKDTISYGKMRDLGIKSVQAIFPESKCDERCLRAQMDAYYKDKCKKPMKPAAGLPNGGSGSGQGSSRD